MQEQFLTVEEVAAIVRVHAHTVNRWCQEGRLKATRVGRRWLIEKSDLDLLLKGGVNKEEDRPKANTLELSF